MENQDKYYTELDKELQQLALIDWPTFVNLVGLDAVTAAKVCLLRSRGKSLVQVANKLNISKSKVETRCDKCPTYSERK